MYLWTNYWDFCIDECWVLKCMFCCVFYKIVMFCTVNVLQFCSRAFCCCYTYLHLQTYESIYFVVAMQNGYISIKAVFKVTPWLVPFLCWYAPPLIAHKHVMTSVTSCQRKTAATESEIPGNKTKSGRWIHEGFTKRRIMKRSKTTGTNSPQTLPPIRI